MVRGIFCHDLPIYKDVNGVYCSTTLTDSLFSRYFVVVDELVVATRVYPIDKTYEEAHQEKISLPNIHFIEIPNLNTFGALFGLISKYKRLLLQEVSSCDLIFIRGGMNALLGVDVAKKLGKPYLLECSGCAWETYWNHSFVGKLLAPYMEYRARIDVRDAAYVIYVTERQLQNRYPTRGKSTFASNVILTNIDDNNLARRILRIKDNKKRTIIIGTTAGLIKTKGQQYVIRAMDKLRSLYDIRYELVGGGDNSYLKLTAKKHHLEEKVIFKGQLNHKEVLSWLDTIDVYIQPSLQEGLPRALVEAMSRACPAIGAKTAGIPELLMKEAVFKSGSSEAIAKSLEIILSDDLIKHAKYNFNKSKEYELRKLNQRRNAFYLDYKNYVVDNRNK